MKILLLASGKGSNARAVIESSLSGALRGKIEVCALISDNQNCPALTCAHSMGIESVFIDPLKSGARIGDVAVQNYIEVFEKFSPDLILLAGFMRIIPEKILERFPNKIINLHPSLLPAFKGKDAIKQALDYGVKVCGCTLHYVSSEIDGGKIISQKTVEISPKDTFETLEEKVHASERAMLIETLEKIHAAQVSKNEF